MRTRRRGSSLHWLTCFDCLGLGVGLPEVPLAGLPRPGGGDPSHMHGRARMTIDTRILTMQGWSTSGFLGLGRNRGHYARSVVR